MAATASLNAAAPPATLQPLASSAVAPLDLPQTDEQLTDQLIDILKLIYAILAASSPEAANSPEHWMLMIQDRYNAAGVPQGLSPEQRAQGRSAIAEARDLMNKLEHRLDGSVAAPFKSTLNQIDADLSQ